MGGCKKAPAALAWPFHSKYLLVVNYFPLQTVLTAVLQEKYKYLQIMWFNSQNLVE